MTARIRQRGYLLVTVIITLFLVASIAVLLAHDSASSANTANRELEAARADYVARAGMQHALWVAQNNACLGNVTIPETALGSDTYDATVSGASAGTLLKLPSDQDAWIRSDDVSRNNGTTTWNHIRFETAGTEQVLTRFDLSSIAANAQISSAVAWFHLKSGKNHPEGPISIHEITADWTETGVTWESFSGEYRASPIGIIPAQYTGDVWVAVNLTAQVQAWVNGQPNNGILFNAQADGTHAEYTAREDSTNPPRLEVVVGSGEASPVTIKAKGILDNGVVRDAKDKLSLAYQPGTRTILQPDGAQGEDAWITAGQTGWNYGAHATLRVQPAHQQTFLRFDLRAQVPAGAWITAARLELYPTQVDTSDAVDLYRVTRSWAEGSCFGNCGPDDGVTWNTYDGANSWATPGGDSDKAAAATATPALVGEWVTWDITELAAAWAMDPDGNYGVLFKGNPGKAAFASSDDPDPALHPRLAITYACECGSACLGPRSTGNVLMVVGDDKSPTIDDIYIKDLIESWGYVVDIIADDAVQADFDSVKTLNDVVLISDSADPIALGAKLGSPTIGIVNANGALNDVLGFESGKSSNWPVGYSLKVEDTSHYITAPFAAGVLDIYNVDMGGLAIGGTPAVGVETLAKWGSSPALAVLELGATTASGGTTAGRRVMLPFGPAGKIDWTEVNNNGHLILQRSLDWAMDVAGGLRILLVVGISGSLQTRDTGRRDLFESWGHDVTIIDDGASQAEFDDALAVNDVVYVAGTVVAGTLDTKLNDATLGIVNEVAGQLDDFGFHGNATANTVNSNSFTATDVGHYISEPFAGSAVTHFTTGITMPVASAPMAPSLGKVAALGATTWAVPVLATGAERWDGAPSPGRRVNLPFGEAEVSQITEDGQTLLRRSIEWGGGAGTAGKNVLLVVGDPSNLTAEQADKKALMEGWGHEVTLIATAESQAAFDAAADAVDVVYIPELGTTPMSELGTKADNLPKGVITEEARRAIKLGGFVLLPFVDTTSINIVDNTHYITETLSIGNVVLSTATQSFWKLGGTLAPDLHILGELTGAVPGLAYVDIGELVNDSSPAAGRRVKLPWGSYNFDINLLTSEGIEIMRRAIEWAATDIPATGPIAHWMLDDGTGLMAVDSEGGHDGTLTNGPTWVAGQIGDALDFPGNDDYVNVPHDDALSLTNMTISLWLKTPTLNTVYQTMVRKKQQANYQLTTWTDEIVFAFNDGAGMKLFQTTNANLTTNEWHHVVVTLDDTTGDINIYVDGDPIFATTTPYHPLPNTEPLTIGGVPDSSTYWPGMLDDIRLYDYAITATQVADLFAAGSGGGGGGGGGGSCNGTFRDEFSTASFANNDGTLTWDGDWLEVGESDGPSAGDVRVRDDNGPYQLWIRDNNNGGEGVERQADLSGASSATLSFIYRRSLLDTETDYVKLEISSNGDAGPWTELDRFKGAGTDSNYLSFSQSIDGHISANTRIRLISSPTMGNMDLVIFDNIEISCSP